MYYILNKLLSYWLKLKMALVFFSNAESYCNFQNKGVFPDFSDSLVSINLGLIN
jgi:hypothetical protein